MKSVNVYGPQGCGKTVHANQLRRHYGLNTIHDADDQDSGTMLGKEGILYLSQQPLTRLGIRCVSFGQAMAEAKL